MTFKQLLINSIVDRLKLNTQLTIDVDYTCFNDGRIPIEIKCKKFQKGRYNCSITNNGLVDIYMRFDNVRHDVYKMGYNLSDKLNFDPHTFDIEINELYHISDPKFTPELINDRLYSLLLRDDVLKFIVNNREFHMGPCANCYGYGCYCRFKLINNEIQVCND